MASVRTAWFGRRSIVILMMPAMTAALSVLTCCNDAPSPSPIGSLPAAGGDRDLPVAASGHVEAAARHEGELEPDPAAALTDADFERHVETLQAEIPEKFTIVIQEPFVVLGDEDPATVRSRAIHTVKWAVDRLKSQYFQRDPDHIIDIWLFRDDESYTRNAREMFGERPTTPFGYYSPRHRALVMNISTGGGTLVHEIVHPFISANFPSCPAWFNEGLASLYEQASERDGQIIGLTNWRLAGLQDVIKAGELPTFKALTHTTTDEFYADGGINYAQARYLCYHLQERGLLERFYNEFAARAADDPTGYDTLQRIVGVADDDDAMAAFQQRWEEFILELRFPEQ